MAVFLSDEQDLGVDGDDLVAVAQHVLQDRRVPADMETSLLLVDDDTIAALNAEHLNKEGPTDVLAFPIDEPGETPPGVPAILGDVVLCPRVARDQAVTHGRTMQEELQLLVVHGILHLLGIDHDDPHREREMFGLTDRLLADYRSASQPETGG